ncbi:MAG: amino acid permease [Oscillospiraceae bacterium]|nr:amino acid permease [Oscillospiraceae bacterium]
MAEGNTGKTEALNSYLSPTSAWAISVGTSVGWGSLVVTSTNYLSQAGPLGTVLGLLLGGGLMLLLSRNFHYMANRYPDAGGIYSYTKNVFGYDRAFLVFWFLSLTYISMFWANATSLPLFARYFISDVFRFGYLYTIFGYEVYLGEALLTMAAIALVTALCIRSKQAAAKVMVILVFIFTVGITLCFLVSAFGMGGAKVSAEPLILPDRNAVIQVLTIVFISPWAFIGFENITHSSEEFSFRQSKLFRILVFSVITSTALYIFVTLLSVTAYPAGCTSWLDYISRLDEFKGMDGLPAFYAANHYMGSAGVYILMASLLSLIVTSLIGNLRALSRLFYAVSRDGIMAARFSRLNSKQIPANAMLLTALLSLPVPFLGRTAIGWTVDVTTIGATIIYGFVSAAAFKAARAAGDRREQVTGMAGLIIMVVFGIYLLFPNLFSDDTLEAETYILFIVWSVVGFFFFRHIISKDHARRFGKAVIVWIALLALVVLMALIWSGRRDEMITQEAVESIRSYYAGTAEPELQALGESEFISRQLETLHRSNSLNTILVIGLFALALVAMLINHFTLRKYEAETARERDVARDVAYKDGLTGVKSKHAYVEYERDMAARIYDGTVEPFAVLVCDVNGLKHINDTLGHKAGDTYILSASQLLCEYYKHSPVFRIGGDEFAIILQGMDYEKRHETLEAINRQIELNLGTGKVVASLGMTDYKPGEDNTFHSVFTRADGLMYERKQQLKAMGAITRD